MENIHSDTAAGSARKFTYARLLAWMVKSPISVLASLAVFTIWLGLRIPDLVFHFTFFDQTFIELSLIFLPLIFLLISIALIWSLPGVMTAAPFIATIFLSQIWTLGITALLQMPISLLSIVALIFLSGIETIYGLYIVKAFNDSVQTAATTAEAVFTAFTKIALPIGLSIAVTLTALMAFAVNPIDVIHEFAILIFAGMLAFLVLMFTLFPVLLSIFPIRRLHSATLVETHRGWIDRLVNRICLKQPHHGNIVSAFAVITMVCLIGGFGIETETYGIGGADVIHGQILSLGIALIMAFGILWLLLISAKSGLSMLLPVIFPIISTIGVMGWLGVPLTIFTALIPVFSFCLSMVNTVHYIYRYHVELNKVLDHEKAMRATLAAVGPAIIHGTIIISIGFSILMFSESKPLALFAVAVQVGLLAVLAADFILMPMLLSKVELVTMWNFVRVKLRRNVGRKVRFFDGLDAHQIDAVFMAAPLLRLAPREVLFRKGDLNDSMYAVVSGSLDIIEFNKIEGGNGVREIRKVIRQLHAGDVVGEMGFFRSTRRSTTVIATRNTEVLQINWPMIHKLQWLHPLTAQKFFINLMGVICDRLENMMNSKCDQGLLDDLTGLFNKQGFIQLLEDETHRAQRYREELTLCLIGLDLKGKLPIETPEATEVLIRTVCQMLSSEIRRTDTLSRIDHTLFAMVAPKTSQPQADVLCRRLQQVLHRNLTGFGAPSLQVRLAAANLTQMGQESGTDLLERSLLMMQSASE